MSVARAAIARGTSLFPAAARGDLRAQMLVTGGQLASGVGNLAFTLVMARLLAPEAFTRLAVFLAMYLLLHIPLNSISAGSALAPDRGAAVRRKVLRIGFGLCGVLLVGALPLGALLGTGPLPFAALAGSAPVAGLLALERGLLYGRRSHLRAVASLIAEPGIRLTAGVALGLAFGATGAIVAVVAAGYVAFVVARRTHDKTDVTITQSTDGRRAAGWTVAVFALLAVVQNQDLLLAQGLLEAGGAANFAVLSTLGGAAAFATATIPLVLLPRAGEGDKDAFGTALGVAVVLGAGAVCVTGFLPGEIVSTLFGSRYDAVASLALPYVGAMALLGVARVLLAQLCGQGFARRAGWIVAFVAVVHVALIVALAETAARVAAATLASAGLLLVAGAGATVLQWPSVRRKRLDIRRMLDHPALPWLGGAVVVGLILRLLVTRGIWLDEATSILQVQLGFDEMIESLRTTDVHPPLHYAVLWAFARVFGTSELAVRVPSIIAGTLLIPASFWLARELYGAKEARIAAGLTAVAPFAVWYSQEARMYAFFMLFGVLAVVGHVRALRRGGALDWLLFAAASSALVWTQYLGILQVAIQQLVIMGTLWRQRHDEGFKRRLVGWLGASAIVLAALAPLAPFAVHQYTVNEQAGKGFGQVPAQTGTSVSAASDDLSVYAVIANFIWSLWGYHSDATMAQIAALWPFGLLFALLMLGRGRSPGTGALLSVGLVPFIALFAIGLFKRNLFEVRYVAAAVPLLLVIASRLVTTWVRPRWGQIAVAGALSLSLLGGLADQQLNGSNPRLYDFEGALGEITRRADNNDVVVYQPSILKYLVNYYAPDLEARALERGAPGPDHGRRVFVVASFLEKPDNAALTGKAVQRLRSEETLVDQFDRPNVKVWEFK